MPDSNASDGMGALRYIGYPGSATPVLAITLMLLVMERFLGIALTQRWVGTRPLPTLLLVLQPPGRTS